MLYILNIKERKGQSIIEAMVAISALTIGLLGIVHLTTQALSEERGIADNFRASYLAAEGVEISRNIIDGNYLAGVPWNQGFNCASTCNVALDYTSTDLSRGCPSGDQLFFDAASGHYSFNSTGSPTPFTRCVSIIAVSNNEIKVNSIVSWTTRGNPFSINVEDHFFNWRPK